MLGRAPCRRGPDWYLSLKTFPKGRLCVSCGTLLKYEFAGAEEMGEDASSLSLDATAVCSGGSLAPNCVPATDGLGSRGGGWLYTSVDG